MHKHILIATEGSKLAGRGVLAGLDLASRLGAQVTALTVSEPNSHLVPDGNLVALPDDEADVAAQEVLESVRSAASRLDVRCAMVHVKNQYPAEAILREAEAKTCDLVTQSAVPVLVCKQSGPGEWENAP